MEFQPTDISLLDSYVAGTSSCTERFSIPLEISNIVTLQELRYSGLLHSKEW